MGASVARCDRDRSADAGAVEAPEVVETPAPTPSLPGPVVAPILDRAGLINAAARAASAYASGQVAAGADPLVGRPFSVVTPFACGPLPDVAVEDTADRSAPPGLARATWGPDRKTVRLTLDPADWTRSPLIAGPNVESGWEAVEGFWVPRPWLATTDCPALTASQTPAVTGAPAVQTVGLAAVFEQDASRVARRNGRAYSFTVRPPSDSVPVSLPPRGYRVVIEGRIGAFADGRAFRCRAAGPDQRPVCIAAMSLDRVAFTRADGEVLSEWRGA
ncbi:hypothetical protein MMB232_02601 [Brevundimonas subvibrioides]